MSWFTKIATSGTLVMYHATVAGTKIVQEGFKSREQLGGRSALGGGSDDSISFTTDWTVAKGVFDGFMLIWGLVNAPHPLEAIKKHFYSLPENKQKELVSFHKSGHGRNLILDMSGWKYGGFWSWSEKKKPMNAEQLKENGFLPWIGEDGQEEEPVDGRYYNWREPSTIDDVYQFIYDYVKSYLASDPDVYNPVFFGTSAKSFMNIPREDIGIITAEVYIDPEAQRADDYARKDRHTTYRNIGSMAEVRVYDLSTIKKVLFYDNNPGDTPPVSSRQQYYHKNDAVEYAVDMCIKVLKKYYNELKPIFAKHNMAMDGVLSALHQSDDMYSVANTITQILKQLNANYPGSFKNLNNYYQQSRIPPNVENALNVMPIIYRNRIENGEKVDDVVYDWYGKDKIGYNQWYDKVGDLERDIADWQYHYKYKKQMYDKALSEAQFMLDEKYTPEQLHILAEVITTLDKARNIDREFKRVASK